MLVVRRMLTLADREEISRGLAESLEYRDIAVRIGRDASIVSREVARHGGPQGYRAGVADRDAAEAAGGGCPPGCAGGGDWAAEEGLVGRSRAGGCGVRAAARSLGTCPHEAVYQWGYAQPVSPLRAERIALRTGRTRRTRPRPAPAPRIREPRYLDERPAEVEGRAVAGHWEGDLVIGKDGKTAVATLVERTSRFLILVPLTGRDSLTVSEAIVSTVGPCQRRSSAHSPGTAARKWLCIKTLPPSVTSLLRSPGLAMGAGQQREPQPHRPRVLPQGIEITSDPHYLAAVATEINDRPRKIHD